jgi:hypothetical protein
MGSNIQTERTSVRQLVNNILHVWERAAGSGNAVPSVVPAAGEEHSGQVRAAARGVQSQHQCMSSTAAVVWLPVFARCNGAACHQWAV